MVSVSLLKLEVLCMEIFRYNREHEDAVISAIKEDPGWDMFTNEKAIDNYKDSLCESITYVCYEDGTFGGYLRALLDDGFAIYISELFVVPERRNRTIGRTLIAKVKTDFRYLTVYALSDEDVYYEKLGYKRVGSVFEIQ
jgi:GNAT superfamily N-acetyltransferase